MSSVRPNPLLLNWLDLARSSQKPENPSKQTGSNTGLKSESSLVGRLKRKIQATIEEVSHSQNKPKTQMVQKRGKNDTNSELEDLHLLEGFLENENEDQDDVFEDCED